MIKTRSLSCENTKSDIEIFATEKICGKSIIVDMKHTYIFLQIIVSIFTNSRLVAYSFL